MRAMSPVKSLVPSLERHGNFIRDSWDRYHTYPGGKAIFSRLVGMAAPYTGSIHAQVEDLGRGYARVIMRDRRSLRNHLRSVHAIALCNLAELTGNLALMYSLPDDARFIVTGIGVDYLKKARGTITGTSECPIPETNEKREYVVPVLLTDIEGHEVARASLRSLVGPKKNA